MKEKTLSVSLIVTHVQGFVQLNFTLTMFQSVWLGKNIANNVIKKNFFLLTCITVHGFLNVVGCLVKMCGDVKTCVSYQGHFNNKSIRQLMIHEFLLSICNRNLISYEWMNWSK